MLDQIDTSPVLRALNVLAPSLRRLLPADIQAFVDIARPDDHPAVLFVLAQLWAPRALAHFAQSISELSQPKPKPSKSRSVSSRPGRVTRGRGWNLTAAQFAAALGATVQFMASLPADDAEQIAVHHALLESGMHRLFGVGPVARRLGVIARDPHGTVVLGASADSWKLIKCTKASRELLALSHWELPQTAEALCDTMRQVEESLLQLGSWAQMHGKYLRRHVMRKVALLFQRNGVPTLDWQQVPRNQWERWTPDQRERLHEAPNGWTASQWRELAPGVPPLLYSMWACLLAPALALPGAQDLLASPFAATCFRRELARLQREQPISPTPLQVIRAMLAAQR